MKPNHLLASVLAVFLCSCASPTLQVAEEDVETVMRPGTTIIATNSQGIMHIKAEDASNRSYSSSKVEKTFELFSREKRWFGSLGMYRPYGDNDLHAVLEEGQQHFNTSEEAQAWLDREKRWHEVRWTRDGLVVSWKEQVRPGDGYLALSVNVWQIYMAGHKPKSLAGASESSIVIKGARPLDSTAYRLPKARRMNGILFTGRSLGLMGDHGIRMEDVLATLRLASPERKGKYQFYSGHDLNPRIDCYVCTNLKGHILFVE